MRPPWPQLCDLRSYRTSPAVANSTPPMLRSASLTVSCDSACGFMGAKLHRVTDGRVPAPGVNTSTPRRRSWMTDLGSYSTLRVRVEDGVAFVTIDNPPI